MKAPLVQHRLLAALLMGGLVATASFPFDAQAQLAGKRSEAKRAGGKSAEVKREAEFPGATRVEPGHKASPRMSKQLSKMIDGFNDAKFDVALPAAEAILADAKANPYERSLAAQIAGQIKYEQDDSAAAVALFEQALASNGLDNNAHFGVMRMIGVARYSLALDGESVEFALVVADTWQRYGLGRRLMGRLIDTARARGYRNIIGDVLGKNRKMLGMMRALGFEIHAHPEESSLKRVIKPLQG